MCGIAGEVNYGSNPEYQSIQAMIGTMAGRGPDGSGIWTADHVALGHRRLTMLDSEGGHQPMVHKNARESSVGSLALSFAGEIYNHQELRHDLEARGHQFRTRSDTEVILNGYAEYDQGIANRLRGMFAIAIWDDRGDRNRLTLIRDHVGVKPLCYYPTPNGVIFGSDAKAVLAHPLANRSVGLA